MQSVSQFVCKIDVSIEKQKRTPRGKEKKCQLRSATHNTPRKKVYKNEIQAEYDSSVRWDCSF